MHRCQMMHKRQLLMLQCLLLTLLHPSLSPQVRTLANLALLQNPSRHIM
jgi:hypothetical protein